MAYKTRYTTEPSGGGENQIVFREIQTPAYGSSVKITPSDVRSEYIKVLFPQITGAMTLTADVTTAYDGDEMVIKLPMDSTGRTVTFSTGFVTTASTIVGTSSSVCTVNFMFDYQANAWVEMHRAIN